MDGTLVVTTIGVSLGIVTAIVGATVYISSRLATLPGMEKDVHEIKADLAELIRERRESHTRIWKKLGDHDIRLENHEGRITKLEE